jgi:hypothetical protein
VALVVAGSNPVPHPKETGMNDKIVIDSFDVVLSSNDVVNKAIANKLSELRVSAETVFSITTFRSISCTWYTIWYKRCKRCHCALLCTATGAPS